MNEPYYILQSGTDEQISAILEALEHSGFDIMEVDGRPGSYIAVHAVTLLRKTCCTLHKYL